MTEKEFINQIEEFREALDQLRYSTLTCYRVNDYFGITANKYYKVFIRSFLDHNFHISIKHNDKSGYPMLLRYMLTEAFFDECLESGKYKEFY